MLFHVYATHSREECPMYSSEKMPRVLAAWENFEPLAEELGIKVHYLAVSALSHETFILLEADSASAISTLMFSIPIRQDAKIIPVNSLDELVSTAKKVMAARD